MVWTRGSNRSSKKWSDTEYSFESKDKCFLVVSMKGFEVKRGV